MDEDLRRRRAADLADTIRLALGDLDRLAARAREAVERLSAGAGPLEVYGAGAVAHGYYTHLERVFERIARDLNSGPLEGPDWHSRLLRSMTLDRPGVRPALFDRPAANRLDELLRFRHLFRNLYVIDLDSSRVSALLADLTMLHPIVVERLDCFRGFLDAVAAAP